MSEWWSAFLDGAFVTATLYTVLVLITVNYYEKKHFAEKTVKVDEPFEHWLVQLKAEAWAEGALATYQDNEIVGGVIPTNPYTKGTSNGRG